MHRRALVVARVVRRDHLGVLSGAPVGGDADHPDRADGEERQGEGIVAAVEREVVGRLRHESGRPAGVAGSVFHPGHGGDLVGEAQQHLGVDLAGGATRDVVDEEGEVGGGPDGAEVGLDARLRRLRVVGAHHEHAVDAGGGRGPGQLDAVRGVVAAGAGHQGHVDRAPHDPEQLELLLVAERGGLARRAREHQAVGPLLDEPRGQRGGGVEVEGEVVVEGGDHGHHHLAERCAHVSLSLARSRPSVASRSSCSSNHTVW